MLLTLSKCTTFPPTNQIARSVLKDEELELLRFIQCPAQFLFPPSTQCQADTQNMTKTFKVPSQIVALFYNYFSYQIRHKVSCESSLADSAHDTSSLKFSEK